MPPGVDVLSQKQGSFLGKCFCVSAVVGLVLCLRKKSNASGYLLVAGAASIGVWLQRRLYLLDPVARAQYIRAIRQEPFTKSVNEIGVNAMCHLVSLKECQTLVAAEFPVLRFGMLFSKIGRKNMDQCLRANVIPKSALEAALEVDIAKATLSSNEPFTALWGIVGKPGLEYACDMRILPIQRVRSLLRGEYARGFVATAPSDDDRTDELGPTFTTYANLKAYGGFCVKRLGVPKQDFIEIVKLCDESRRYRYSELLQRGLGDIFDLGFADSAWCTQKLKEEIRLHSPTLNELQVALSIRWQLDSGMIAPASVFAAPFTAAIPTSSFDGSSGVLDFMEEHEQLLKDYGADIVEREVWRHVLWAKAKWEATLSAAQERFAIPRQPKKMSDKEYAELVADIRTRRARFVASRRKDIHAEFCALLANGSWWF